MAKNSKTTVYYYVSSERENPIKEFLDSLEGIQQAKILRLFNILRSTGYRPFLRTSKKLRILLYGK